MPDLPTFATLFRVARDEVLSRNSRISRDAVDREGSDANILIAGASAAADEVIGQLAQLQAALYLDAAKGPALDRWVFDRYGLVRKPAAAAVGSVQFRTTVASPVTFTIQTGTILQTADGIQYITTESSIFSAGGIGPITIAVRSMLAGADQGAKINTITSVVTALSSSPSDLTVTNPLATSGADDAETDDSLRDRARKFFLTARRGTNPALEAAALAVPGVRKATAIEVLDSSGRPARMTQLVIADAFTEQFAEFDTVPPRYQAQSQQLAALVFQSLSDVRPSGTYVQVTVASIVLQAIQVTLTFSANADVNTVALQARAMIVDYTNGLSPGAPFRISEVMEKLKMVSGLVHSGCAIVSPVGDIQPKPLQLIRTMLGLVSATSSQTDSPIITGTNPDAYILA
jgi:uncharacterized phage protein gp47/JayE